MNPQTISSSYFKSIFQPIIPPEFQIYTVFSVTFGGEIEQMFSYYFLC